MNIIVEKPQQKAIDLRLLKNHLRIDHDHDDGYLEAIIDISTEILEKNINKAILKKRYKYIVSDRQRNGKIAIPLDNVCDVVAVRFGTNPSEQCQSMVNKHGTIQTVANQNWTKVPKFSISQNANKTYVTVCHSAGPIEIEYYAGFASSNENVPHDIKYAIMQIAAGIYSSFDENILELPYIKYVVKSYRNLQIN